MIIVRYRTLIRSPCDSPSPPAVHPLPLHAHNHAVLAWSLHGGMFSTAVITSCLWSCYRRHVTGCDAMTMTPQKPLTPPVLLHITLFIQLCYILSFSLSSSPKCYNSSPLFPFYIISRCCLKQLGYCLLSLGLFLSFYCSVVIIRVFVLGVYNNGRTGGGFWSGTGRGYALKAAVRNLIGFGRVGSRAERYGRRGREVYMG